MPVGYVYTILAVLSWTALGVLYKLSEMKNCRPLMISVTMFLLAAALLIVRAIFVGKLGFQAPQFVIRLALFFGVNGAIAVIATQRALKVGKLSTTWLVINLATGASTLGAVLIYHELISDVKGVALIMMGIAMALLWIDMREERTHQDTMCQPPKMVSDKDQ